MNKDAVITYKVREVEINNKMILFARTFPAILTRKSLLYRKNKRWNLSQYDGIRRKQYINKIKAGICRNMTEYGANNTLIK